MIKKLAFAAAALALTAASHASTLLFDVPGATGDHSTSTYYATSPGFSSPTSSGVLAFTLDGYNTLDGQNYYEDDFTLVVNGATILKGTFNLGGGGANEIYFGPTGTSVTGYLTDPNVVTGTGGALNFIVPIALLSTGNEIEWHYSSLTDSSHAGYQDIGDEGWGIEKVSVVAVPEPGALALMLAGLGIVGGLARRRRQA